MKKMILDQSIGLFWFVLVYVLVRALIAGPLKIQNTDTIAIVFGVGAMMWLILSYLSSEPKGLGLASSLLPIPIFVYIKYGDFNIFEVKLILAFTLLASFFAVIYSIINVSKEEKLSLLNITTLTITRTVLSIVVLYLVELYVVPFIPGPTF